MPSTLLFTSESVTEGHPDKVCDQISDAVLDECLRQDPGARVACEVAVAGQEIFIGGEITTTRLPDIESLARGVVRDIGYISPDEGFDAVGCHVTCVLREQSPEIAEKVKIDADTRAVGAGDQGMMFGFACAETPELMPLPISLAHAVAQELAAARKSGRLAYLRPDGKTQVTVEYADGRAMRAHTVVVAAQHEAGVPLEELARDVRREVVERAIDPRYLDPATEIIVNGTGPFTRGGPAADAGLTGRKIIVDTYGGSARHGGGAFSGKDPTKVDRSAAYAARYVAKNVVAAGLAERFELQVAYMIGRAEPLSISIQTFATATVSEDRIRRAIDRCFDFRPGAIIERLDLRRAIYRQTATYGHFGRPDLDLPWERTDLGADLLREAQE